jgi:hypothetical protein
MLLLLHSRRVLHRSYGILVYGHGPASDGFAMEVDEEDVENTSSDIVIRRNVIKGLSCVVNEVLAAVENGTAVVDARGAVLQFYDTYTNKDLAINTITGTYKGNLLSDAQIMTAAAIHDRTLYKTRNDPQSLTGKNTITENIVKWATGISYDLPIATSTYDPKFRCLGDAMHHVTKGIVAIRVEET